MVKSIGHFIGGKHVQGTSGRFADIFNPNTGEVSARVALASQAELRAAVVFLLAMKRYGISDPKRIPACTVMWHGHDGQGHVLLGA